MVCGKIAVICPCIFQLPVIFEHEMDGNRQTGVVVNNTGRSGGVSGLPLEFVAGSGAEVWRSCCAGRAAGVRAACRGAVRISVFLTLPHSVASAVGHILRLT